MLFSAIKPVGVQVLNHSFLESYNSLILADSSGFLNTLRLASLAQAYGQKMKNLRNKGIHVQKTCRRFMAHTSDIIWNKHLDHDLFSAANSENCIVQWKIMAEDPNWDLDSSEFLTTAADPFCEILPNEKFNKVFTETWMPQSEMVVKTEKSIDLVLEACIGRRARDRRNNLKYDSDDRVLFATGNNLVIHSRESSNQLFLQYNYHGARTKLSEISSFCLTEDKRNIFIGTCDLEGRIMLWDLFAYVMIFSLPIPDTCIIQTLSVSQSCRYLGCIGLNKMYKQILILIEISSDFLPRVVSSTLISSTCVYKIKELSLSEKNGLEIYTCGVQHFTRWELNSDILHNYALSLPDEQAICLLCISFISCVSLTAADDGKLYIWYEDKLFSSVPSHDGCVLSLIINEEMAIGVTGGVDGHIIVWKITVQGSGETLQVKLDSLREYSLHDPNANVLAYSVQSLSIGKVIEDEGFNVLIGTQNGDAYELTYAANADLDTLVKVSAAVDSQSILSMACDVSSYFLFTISAGGIFAVWEIRSFSQVYTFDFHKNAVKLAVFHLKTFDDVAFDGQVLFVTIGFEDEVVLIKIRDGEEVDHELLTDFTINVDTLTDFKVSTDERFMALACNKDQRPQVDIYQIKATEWIIDKNFSTDGYYLMCEDNLGEVLLLELETQNIASFHSIEFEIDWLNDGLRHSTGLKSIHQLYNINNKIACITKSPGLSILGIGDEFGVVALYQLPYVPGTSLIMIPGHSYRVSIIMFTHDDRYLITYSEMDRCILKWRIVSDL
jgi:WD40 repeat protein